MAYGQIDLPPLYVDDDGAGNKTPAYKILDGTAGSVTPVATGVGVATNALRVCIASNLAFAEDAAHVSGDLGIQFLAVRKDAAGTLVSADGDYSALQLDSSGALRVTGGGGGTQFAEDVAHASGDIGTLALAVRRDAAAVGSGTDGDYSTLNVDANGRLYVACDTHAVSTVTTLTGSGVAHDAVDSGNPHKIGARASTALHSVTLVADADRTDLLAGTDGVLVVRQDATPESFVNGNASNTDGASTQVVAAAGAGVKVYLTDVTLTNTSASNIYVEIKDGTTVKWTFPVPANGGVTHSFRTPIPGTANTAWNFDPSAAATTVYCSMSGFKSKV